MSLADLIRKGALRGFATATTATVATHKAESAATVARVATVAVAKALDTKAANDPPPDPDRWCWPHSTAMNTAEIDTFTARLARFTDKGASLEEAERLADKLVIRDREGDDRRLCLECAHLHGAGRWRCGNWDAADVAREGLAPDLVKRLQRCSGYPHATNNGA